MSETQSNPGERQESDFQVDNGQIVEELRGFVLDLVQSGDFPVDILSKPYEAKSLWITGVYRQLQERLAGNLLDGEKEEITRGGVGKTLAQIAEIGEPVVIAWGDPDLYTEPDLFDRYYVSILWDFKTTKGGIRGRSVEKGKIHMNRTDIQIFNADTKRYLPLPELHSAHVGFSIETTRRKSEREQRIFFGDNVQLDRVGEDIVELDKIPTTAQKATSVAVGTGILLIVGTKIIQGKKKRK